MIRSIAATLCTGYSVYNLITLNDPVYGVLAAAAAVVLALWVAFDMEQKGILV